MTFKRNQSASDCSVAVSEVMCDVLHDLQRSTGFEGCSGAVRPSALAKRVGALSYSGNPRKGVQ